MATRGNLSDTSWLICSVTVSKYKQKKYALDTDQTDNKGRVSQKKKDLAGRMG